MTLSYTAGDTELTITKTSDVKRNIDDNVSIYVNKLIPSVVWYSENFIGYLFAIIFTIVLYLICSKYDIQLVDD